MLTMPYTKAVLSQHQTNTFHVNQNEQVLVKSCCACSVCKSSLPQYDLNRG